MNTRRNKRQIEAEDRQISPDTIDPAAAPPSATMDSSVTKISRDAFDRLPDIDASDEKASPKLDASSPKFDGERRIDAVLDASSPKTDATDGDPLSYEKIEWTVLDDEGDASSPKDVGPDGDPLNFEKIEWTVLDDEPEAFQKIEVTLDEATSNLAESKAPGVGWDEGVAASTLADPESELEVWTDTHPLSVLVGDETLTEVDVSGGDLLGDVLDG